MQTLQDNIASEIAMQARASSKQIFKQIVCGNFLQRKLCHSPAKDDKAWKNIIHRLKADNVDRHQLSTDIYRRFNPTTASDYAIKQDIRSDIYQFYYQLTKQDKISFLVLLYENLQIDVNEIPGSKERNIKIPLYEWIFQEMKNDSEGVKFLIDCRADLLDHVSKNRKIVRPEISTIEKSLKGILKSYFTEDVLTVHAVRKDASSTLKEKLVKGEAVHAYRGNHDIMQRIGRNRRCFILTNEGLHEEPLAILHTELANKVTSKIHDIIDKNADQEEVLNKITVAIFYSVSVTNKGLSGFQFGQHIIGKASKLLQQEFPYLRRFLTLSPIPGFRMWLLNELRKGNDSQHLRLIKHLQNVLNSYGLTINDLQALEQLSSSSNKSSADGKPAIVQAIAEILLPLCASYLALERNKGHLINSVANFHVGNGACIYRLNWLADLTTKGITSSFGIMVNYEYILEEKHYHRQQYRERRQVGISSSIHHYLRDYETVNKLCYIANANASKSKL